MHQWKSVDPEAQKWKQRLMQMVLHCPHKVSRQHRYQLELTCLLQSCGQHYCHQTHGITGSSLADEANTSVNNS